MTIDKQIRTALVVLGYDCYHDTYTGEDETYFVFNYNVVPDDYSDDAPDYNRYLCQVHLFAPITLNTVELSKRVKLLLENADFTYPEQVNASDADSQHIVFEFEGIEEIDRSGEWLSL